MLGLFPGRFMGKILLLLLIALVVYVAIKKYQRSLTGSAKAEAAKSPAETMVKCAHCGVNLPRGEALISNDAYYCTPEHQKLGEQ